MRENRALQSQVEAEYDASGVGTIDILAQGEEEDNWSSECAVAEARPKTHNLHLYT